MKKIAVTLYVMLILSVTMSFGFDVEWEQVYKDDIVIGDGAVQDFSKENLIFQMNCTGVGNDKIGVKFHKPQKMLLMPIANYVLETEIHYDPNYYLIIHKIDDPSSAKCMYKCQIYKRK